jgi:hypothetical protein
MKYIGKVSTGLILTMVSLAIIIMITICMSSCNVVAYNSFPNYTTVKDSEGFTPTINYAKYSDGSAVDIKDNNLINGTDSSIQRVKNMQGLFGSPDLPSKLDIYSDAKGSLSEECALKSHGLSNSKGYLCLDQNQMKMLSTRGGNQTPM